MTDTTIATQCSFVITINRLVKAIMLLLLSAISSNAQEIPNITYGSMPPAIAPGSPAGSYALSGLDNISLYSGQINLRLPLLQVGGRGGAGYTMTLNFDQRWRVYTFKNTDPTEYYLSPEADWFDGYKPGYGPGVLQGRRVGDGVFCQKAMPTLTRLTFTTPDGTQHELRDTLNNGKPLDVACSQSIPHSRGTVFTSADGEAMTFISDSPIVDALSPQWVVYSFPRGMLYFRDGTRYRIDTGAVTWMQDRNGNRVSFTYDAFWRVTQITDSVNRVITVSYANMTTVFYDQITFKGASGAPRTIRVWYANLDQVLRPGYTLGTEVTLFPELNDGQAIAYNPTKVSMVELPDGRSYKLYYNPYGEPARVELPTGGAYEYDYNQGSGCINPAGSISNAILRRVKKRRVYPDGVTAKEETVYNETIDPAAQAVYVEVARYDQPGGTLLEREKHYFYGDPIDSFFMKATDYPSWKEGLEYQSEKYAVINGTVGSVLQRTVNTWAQRAQVNWYPLQFCYGRLCTPDYEPRVDPRVVETVTTLADANLVSKQTIGYDQYNNQTDVYEYDFGAGAPGPLVRRTHTDYVTLNNGVDYAADTNIHIRNLPLQQQVFDAGGTKRAETFYEYDLYDTSPNHAPLIDRPGISGLDSGFTTGYTTRGNVTRTSSALLNNSGGVTGWANGHAQYDIAGNVVKAIDANGNATTLDFSDRFGSPGDDARQNTPPAELNGQTSYAFATKVTNALGHTAYTKYDYYLGKPVNIEDANGIVSSVAYNDALDRPTQGIQARYKVTTPPCAPPSVCVPAEKRQTTIAYDDTNHVIITTSDQGAFGDNILTSKSYYDGLGRTWRSAAYEGATWTIKDTQFDALGRVSQISNPYRAAERARQGYQGDHSRQRTR